MVKLYDSGVYLLNGNQLVSEKEAAPDLNKDEAKKGTIAYGILQAHNVSGDPDNLKIKFDSITSHDLTYVGVIHQYMRETMAGGGRMILGSDSHTRYGALGTMAVGEGGGGLVKQILEQTWDTAYPEVVAVYLDGKVLFDTFYLKVR